MTNNFRKDLHEDSTWENQKKIDIKLQKLYINNVKKGLPVVVKRQAEEVGKRAPHKLRAQKNLKLKTRARHTKRAQKLKSKKTVESKYG